MAGLAEDTVTLYCLNTVKHVAACVCTACAFMSLLKAQHMVLHPSNFKGPASVLGLADMIIALL